MARFCACGALAPDYGACASCGTGPKPRAQSTTAAGYGHRWQKGLRHRQLRREPRCQYTTSSGERCRKWARDVDHIIPKSQGGADALDNLQSLCHRHHSMKTAAEIRARKVAA